MTVGILNALILLMDKLLLWTIDVGGVFSDTRMPNEPSRYYTPCTRITLSSLCPKIIIGNEKAGLIFVLNINKKRIMLTL